MFMNQYFGNSVVHKIQLKKAVMVLQKDTY